MIGDADGADLARLDHAGERAGDLLRVGQQVAPVNLVKVDHVDAQPCERRVYGLGEIVGGGVVGEGAA